MPINSLIECTYCGTSIDPSKSERCKKCTKYINEDPEEFAKYIEEKEMKENEE